MARRNNKQTMGNGVEVSLFNSESDGGVSFGMLVSCHADSAAPMYYRVSGDQDGEWGHLKPGETATIYAQRTNERKILWILGKGDGGTATGGVEEVVLG